MDRLNEYYKNALMGNLCKEYKYEWQRAMTDKESLVRLAMAQQAIPHMATYAHMGKGLTKDYIKQTFKDYINGYTLHDADGVDGYTYGLYVDYDPYGDITVDKDVIHIMWTIGTTIIVPKTKCPTIYLSNRSDIHLVCNGYNNVHVYMLDDTRLTIEDADEESTVTVFKYSDKCRMEQGRFCMAKVKEFNKELRL